MEEGRGLPKHLMFQFLIGRLDTENLKGGRFKVTTFQFLIGRLDTGPGACDDTRSGLVSIPHR